MERDVAWESELAGRWPVGWLAGWLDVLGGLVDWWLDGWVDAERDGQIDRVAPRDTTEEGGCRGPRRSLAAG